MKKIKYVQLEPQAWLADADWQRMNATERGVYSSLILLLYSNGGKFQFDIETLQDLCRCENFKKVWKKIAKKFQKKNGFIKHKRVTKELRKAQAKQKQALKAAKARWDKQCSPNAAASDEHRQRNVIEGNVREKLRIRKDTEHNGLANKTEPLENQKPVTPTNTPIEEQSGEMAVSV